MHIVQILRRTNICTFAKTSVLTFSFRYFVSNNTHVSYSCTASATALKKSSIPWPVTAETPTACNGKNRQKIIKEEEVGGWGGN